MEGIIEKKNASGLGDYTALALTTWGVGYIPGAPGTYGSIVGVAIYFGITAVHAELGLSLPTIWAINALLLAVLVHLGIWASRRAEPLLGETDPHEAVVDEVMGQLVVFLFVPAGLAWPFALAAFILFRLFDILKPYPIDDLQHLPGGLGICADDLVAGFYAGICLSAIYAISLTI